MKKTRHIGIDEVGRGPLAGPVTVCAFAVPTGFDKRILSDITDSKQLTEKRREEWNRMLRKLKKEKKIDFVICSVGNHTIDTKGISYAVSLAIKRCLTKLDVDSRYAKIYLDGGLKAPAEYVYQKTIIKGDSKNKLIASASVLTKVYRDRYMTKMAKRYPAYGFDSHKGYGTKKHRRVIKTDGICPLHRESFLKNI